METYTELIVSDTEKLINKLKKQKVKQKTIRKRNKKSKKFTKQTKQKPILVITDESEIKGKAQKKSKSFNTLSQNQSNFYKKSAKILWSDEQYKTIVNALTKDEWENYLAKSLLKVFTNTSDITDLPLQSSQPTPKNDFSAKKLKYFKIHDKIQKAKPIILRPIWLAKETNVQVINWCELFGLENNDLCTHDTCKLLRKCAAQQKYNKLMKSALTKHKDTVRNNKLSQNISISLLENIIETCCSFIEELTKVSHFEKAQNLMQKVLNFKEYCGNQSPQTNISYFDATAYLFFSQKKYEASFVSIQNALREASKTIIPFYTVINLKIHKSTILIAKQRYSQATCLINRIVESISNHKPTNSDLYQDMFLVVISLFHLTIVSLARNELLIALEHIEKAIFLSYSCVVYSGKYLCQLEKTKETIKKRIQQI